MLPFLFAQNRPSKNQAFKKSETPRKVSKAPWHKAFLHFEKNKMNNKCTAEQKKKRKKKEEKKKQKEKSSKREKTKRKEEINKEKK